MRVLVLYAHPNEDSYVAAIRRRAVARLEAGGHQVDLCDLYAEAFDPVLSREERLAYHDVAVNTRLVAGHVARLRAAEALVIISPVWNFGFPAILKGYLDRVFLPGVSFALADGKVVGCLHNVRFVAGLMTYGATPLRAFLAGDPPRKFVTRVLRALVSPGARTRFAAHYDMNRSTEASRARFLDRVDTLLAGL